LCSDMEMLGLIDKHYSAAPHAHTDKSDKQLLLTQAQALSHQLSTTPVKAPLLHHHHSNPLQSPGSAMSTSSLLTPARHTSFRSVLSSPPPVLEF
jgi:hypothetical protein